MMAKGEDQEIILAAAKRLLAKPGAADRLRSLPVRAAPDGERSWAYVALPEWAEDLVPAGKPGLFLPLWGAQRDWRGVDWWAGAAALLTCQAEREHEARNGPTHSYSFRLGAEFRHTFDHAWVNRIVLFLRRWWCIENEAHETEVFGPLPKPIVHLTHDVDAVSKTLAIRAKQAAFSLYNRRTARAARFLLGPADYWQFDRILALETSYGRTSLWNVYGGRGGWVRSPKEILMDPAYCVTAPRLAKQLRSLLDAGHRIGLHPQFDTWNDADRFMAEKARIESATGAPITEIRQHWLRFSFSQTWAAQTAAGLTHDYTLGFNDRSGFRSGAALSHIDRKTGMRVTPMILMDSHLYDYAQLSQHARERAIDCILDELVATGGEASVIWHQRVFHSDYGWGKGYEYLLDGLRRRGIAEPNSD